MPNPKYLRLVFLSSSNSSLREIRDLAYIDDHLRDFVRPWLREDTIHNVQDRYANKVLQVIDHLNHYFTAAYMNFTTWIKDQERNAMIRKRTFKEAPARYQVEVSREKLEKMEELRRIGGLRSKKELFDYAFTLLSWIVKQVLQGRSIAAINENGEVQTVLAMPYLENVAMNAKQHLRDVLEPQSELRM